MASTGGPNGSLRRLRISAGIILTGCITIMLLADVLAGSLGIRADYRVEPLVLGSVLGTLMLIIGIEIGSRWPPFGGGQ